MNIISDTIHLTFEYYFDQTINSISDNVTHITFGWYFNQPLSPGVIPINVTHITFGWCFNKSLDPGTIPVNTTHLILGNCFNQQLQPKSIPVSVTHLSFGHDFNQDIDSMLTNVTHLTFGWCFDQKLNPSTIPVSVTHLTFGWCFNQPLNSQVIPTNITRLTFGYKFNQPINFTNNNLSQLNFFGNEDIKLDDTLVENIELEINYQFLNKHFNKFRIINLFAWGHFYKIPTDIIDSDKYIIEREYNDYINDDPVTKIKLIPKFILQSKIKSAKKIIIAPIDL